jgi:hypothetical protein
MDDSNSCTTDEWIQEAFYEYELIANLCNEQSHLGNAALSNPPPPSLRDDDDDANEISTTFDPKRLETAMKHCQLVDHLFNYSQSIDSVRNTHLRLKSKLAKGADEATGNGKASLQLARTPRRTSSAIEEAFSNHIGLSERVIRTVTKSSKTDCGVLFGNGMIRPSSASDHEANVVALAALRASISQLKADFGSRSASSS